ncbi:MAG: hypothetical protein ACYC3X_03975 [Pirellulaceae bacterium]
MLNLWIVVVIIVLLTCLVLCVYVADRRANQEAITNAGKAYGIPSIDGLSSLDAMRGAIIILNEYGQKRMGTLDGSWANELHNDTLSILRAYELLTFDSLTNQLECNAHNWADASDPDYVRIGTWPAGEGVFAARQSADPKILIEVGEHEFEILAPTIFHYILKAKQESDWADEILDH